MNQRPLYHYNYRLYNLLQQEEERISPEDVNLVGSKSLVLFHGVGIVTLSTSWLCATVCTRAFSKSNT
jgi:hypothetical protein